MLYHDSHDPFYRCPLEPVPIGGKLTLRFWCDEGTPRLRIWDGEEHFYDMTPLPDSRWEVQIWMPETPQLIWYCFVIQRTYDIAEYGNANDQLGGIGSYYASNAPGYQLTVYSDDYKTPDYLHGGIVYQIFPDRFYRSNKQTNDSAAVTKYHRDAFFHERWDEKPLLDIDPVTQDNRALDFFGGNLSGISEKLDYLSDLGITILYLNPIFQAHSNHRYDTGDYLAIDSLLGSKGDFEELCAEAQKRNIKIILDGVFSHTGSDSRYFNRYGHYDSVGAYQSRESEYANWYHFRSYPNDYKSWWGFETLPEVDKDEPSYRRFLLDEAIGILPTWIQNGACGWRLDVADELPMSLISEMRACLHNTTPDTALLGEVWEDASNKVSYGKMRCYCLGDTLDSVMNYPLRRAIIDFFTEKTSAYDLVRLIRHQREAYPIPFFYSLMNLLGSHDRVRALNALAGYDTDGNQSINRQESGTMVLNKEEAVLAKKRYLQAVRLLCSLPGMPTIYYGDEIGMTGMNDPFNRAPMNWNDVDEEFKNKIRSILQERQNSQMLQTGYLKIEAANPETLTVTRYGKDGKDVFGQPLNEPNLVITIQAVHKSEV